MISRWQITNWFLGNQTLPLIVTKGDHKGYIGDLAAVDVYNENECGQLLEITCGPYHSIQERSGNVFDATSIIKYCTDIGISVRNPDGSYKSIYQLSKESDEEFDKMKGLGFTTNNTKLWDFYIQGSVTTKVNIADVNIIVPNKVVEVTFSDGSKEKAVCKETDTFTLEQAISICIGKKLMGGSSAYNNAVKQGVKVYESKLKKEISELEEKERIARKKIKKLNYQKRRAARREEEEAMEREAEKERQIEIQKEAYIRAMQCMNESKGSDVE